MEKKECFGSVERDIKHRTGKKYPTEEKTRIASEIFEEETGELRGRDGITRNDYRLELNSLLFQSFQEQTRQMNI